MIAVLNLFAYPFLFIIIYFEVFLIINFLAKRNKIKIDAEEKEVTIYPTVTIIVPCFNEEKTIIGTIDSLLNLDYLKEKLKILIVNDGSTDNTLSVIEKFENNTQIRIFSKENGGKHTALNYGLRFTESELIGCLDADSFVAPCALKRMVSHFQTEKVMAVVPAIKVHNPRKILELAQNVEYNVNIFLRKIFGFMGALHVTPGPFSVFRKEVFENLGGYKHGHNTEDMEMALRMQAAHYKIDNSHKACVYTVVPNSVKALYKQRLRWTYGFMANAKDYKHMFFRKKYGDLGVFILPFAFVAIFSALYFITLFALNISGFIIAKIERISTIGFNTNMVNINTDWFFMNTGAIIFLSITVFALVILVALIGKRMAEDRSLYIFDMLLYLTIYGFIAPFWITKAVYNFAFSKATSWN